jgi:hypothetical protein
MEQASTKGEPAPDVQSGNGGAAAVLFTERPPTVNAQQMNSQPCPTCGVAGAVAVASRYVYAVGRVEPRFPSLGLEREFAQVRGRTATKGLTDRQTFQAVLAKRENRHLVRQLCWVLMIEGIETYILKPRDPSDFDLLIQTVREEPTPMDMDVVVGVRGPIAGPELCNGLMVPIVVFDQIYSFDRDALIKSIPKQEKTDTRHFARAAAELLDRIMQMADNAGATDEHRVLNYLVVRYAGMYGKAAEKYAADASLTAVHVRPSALSGTRKIVEVIFSFTDRSTDVIEKFSVRVDVTEEFPFLINKLTPYFDR